MRAPDRPEWLEARARSGVPSPVFWEQLVSGAVVSFDVRRIWLFGSRARGDYRRASDLDLAFDFAREKESGFSRFWAVMNDEAQTLLPLDLVDFGTCQAALRKEIESHGKVVYERD